MDLEGKKPENIETERLLLRAFTAEDAAELYEYAKNPNVGPHAGWMPHQSIEDSREIIEGLFLVKYYIWAIVDKASGKLIGSIGYEEDEKRPETGCMELGYAMDEDFWGLGLMTEAAGAVIRYGFESMKLPAVSIYHNPENHRSKRVIEKNGFRYEGVLRRANRIYDGEIRDVACYSLLKAEWKESVNKNS